MNIALRSIVFCTLLIVTENLWAQDSLKVIQDLNTLKTKPSHLEAKNYLGRNWNRGDIFLFNGEAILSQEIRYDLDNNLVEVRVADEVKMVSALRIRSFQWIDPDQETWRFVNCASYQYKEWLEGFYRILVEGEVSLLVRIETREFGSTQAVSVDTERFTEDDTPDPLIERLLISKGGVVKDLGKKKEILEYFDDKSSQVEAYAKENKLGFRNQRELIEILEYHNGLN